MMHEKAEVEQCMWKVQNTQGDFSLNHCPKSDLCVMVLQVKDGPNLSLTSGCVNSWTLLVLMFSLQIWLDTSSYSSPPHPKKKKKVESVSLSSSPLSQMNSNARKVQWEELYGWVCEVRRGVVRQVVSFISNIWANIPVQQYLHLASYNRFDQFPSKKGTIFLC